MNPVLKFPLTEQMPGMCGRARVCVSPATGAVHAVVDVCQAWLTS